MNTSELLEAAWGIIANVNWNEQSDEWRSAADRWRREWEQHWSMRPLEPRRTRTPQ